MSKRKLLSDAFDEGRRTREPAPDQARTGPAPGPEKPLIGPGQAPEKDRPRRQRKVWLRDDEWEALRRYFQDRGQSASTGLRRWILERMQQERVAPAAFDMERHLRGEDREGTR